MSKPQPEPYVLLRLLTLSRLTLWPHEPARLLCPWDSPGKNTGVGFHALLQGIFPTQRLNPGFPHCTQILYPLNHQGSPRILERVADPFSRGSFRPRNRSGVSCIAGRFFINWATREGPGDLQYTENTPDFIRCDKKPLGNASREVITKSCLENSLYWGNVEWWATPYIIALLHYIGFRCWWFGASWKYWRFLDAVRFR